MNRKWMDSGAVATLIALTLVAYAPVLECGFVDFDDDANLIHNAAVQHGLTPASLVYAWTTFDSGNWIPLTWMSFLVDATLFGIQPMAFHAVNVGWHTANVCLLYLLLRRWDGTVGVSTVVAALFAVHPLHVESVAWVSERKDVLSTFWLLITLLIYERYAARPQNRVLYYGVALTLTLGLLAKSMLVTLPVLLWLVDYWPLNRWAAANKAGGRYPARTTQQLISEKLPWLALAFVDGLITIQAQQAGNAVKDLALISGLARVTNAIRAVGWYLWKTICPTELCAFYPLPLSNIAWGRVAAATITVIVITALVWRYRRDRRHLVFGWGWFFISLLPVLGLLQVGTQAQADRYVYVPHIGLLIAIVWGAWRHCAQTASRRSLFTAGMLVAVAACVPLTRTQVLTWKNTDRLWQQAIAVDPENHLAHYYLGMSLAQRNQFAAAADHFRRSLEHPRMTMTSAVYLGDIHARQGEWEQAAHYFGAVLQADPGNKFAGARLPIVLGQLRKQRESIPRP